MIRDILSLLQYEAKRNPTLARLIADLPALTEAEIEQAKVKMPWMRQALLRMKRQTEASVLAKEVNQWSTIRRLADPIGEMRRWIGPDTFIKIGRSQLEVTSGQLIWVNDGMWIDTIFSKDVDPQVFRFGQPCGMVTRLGYIQAVRQRANSLMSFTEPEPEPVSREPFRIYRIPTDP